MLEYDNSAFYYFALTLLVIYILPGTYYAISEFIAAFFGSGEVGAKARTKLEKDKANELKKQTTGWARLNTTSYITNLALLVVAWTIFLYLINLVKNDGDVSTFDPYSILGLEQGSTLTQIKKQYRKLSLQYHPDKNIGNKVAEEMFMKIAKAYEALTDETAKENYEKYGNPDGKQALEVSIGLPKILLENPKVVLVLYLIAMVIVIPAVVGWWYSNSKQYGEKNILYETYEAFYSLLQESHRVKNLPEILAASAEFRTINTPKPSDNEPMNALYETLKKDKVMIKPRLEQPKILRGNLLLHAHMMRLTDGLNEPLKKDLRAMLLKSPDLLEGLIEIAQYRKWFDTSIAAIKLSQCLTQAIWNTTESFLQLPFLNEEDIKKIKAALPQGKPKTLASFLTLSDEEKRKFVSHLSSEDQEEFVKASNLFPRLKIESKLYVEEEDEEEEGANNNNNENNNNQVKGDQIFEQDLVTLKLTLTRENLPIPDKLKHLKDPNKSITTSPVYAPHFPGTIYENWWVVVTDKPKNGKTENPVIHAFEKINDQHRVVKHELKFYAPQHQGKYEIEVQIYSECYLGMDEVFSIPFEVHPATELPEYTPHPEDVELDNEPTVFEQLMAANQDDSSDDEDDDEADDDDDHDHAGHNHPHPHPPKRNNANNKSNSNSNSKQSKAGKKAVRVVEEVEEEDDE